VNDDQAKRLRAIEASANYRAGRGYRTLRLAVYDVDGHEHVLCRACAQGSGLHFVRWTTIGECESCDAH